MNTHPKEQAEAKEKAANEMNFGQHLIGYLTHQLAIVQEPENLATIERIRSMSYAQLQRFHIRLEPVVDDFYKIKGYRIIREIKK